ncbi:E3 ubiquitin protein ligase RFWD3-like protein [Tanacetum coccineum]|uniref:E3 ubiquitin protein ligase RFWD3-like protein n=1 Tax=Tanacetum coccineum TaxID=301880 RepID=A0ABQ5B517_9ASTR
MSHHQSTIQFDDQNLIHLNLDLTDDESLDDEFDSDYDYDYDYEDEIDVYDDESEDYDDEIDDIEEEEEDDDELNEMMSVLDLDDGVVVNDVGDSEGLVSVSWCGRGDGLICPICFEGWTSGGEHQMWVSVLDLDDRTVVIDNGDSYDLVVLMVENELDDCSCLPCGHIYGLSCINKWLQRFRGLGKCPQCKNLCTLKDVRVLYASRLCAADEELHERVRALEAKCADLEKKAIPLTPEELIDQICSNPALVQRLAAALAELNQQQAVP